MNAAGVSARLNAADFMSGQIDAIWSGNDALDAVLSMEGSRDGIHWGSVGSTIGDVGSVLIDTANEAQLWAFTFQQGFPLIFVRFSYDPGANTTGLLVITFTGYFKAPGV